MGWRILESEYDLTFLQACVNAQIKMYLTSLFFQTLIPGVHHMSNREFQQKHKSASLLRSLVTVSFHRDQKGVK